MQETPHVVAHAIYLHTRFTRVNHPPDTTLARAHSCVRDSGGIEAVASYRAQILSRWIKLKENRAVGVTQQYCLSDYHVQHVFEIKGGGHHRRHLVESAELMHFSAKLLVRLLIEPAILDIH